MSVKLISAAVVLLVGFALASLFPNREQATGSGPAPVGVALRRAAAEPQRNLAETLSVGESQTPRESAAVPDATSPATSLAATHPGRGSFRSPPSMPSDFAADREGTAPPLAAVDRPSGQRPSSRFADTPPHKIVHRIVDGDTLAGLATRYLGDARLADHIRQANRDRLPANPNWLPIGVELQIPARTEVAVQPSTIARHDAAETRLVPVEPVPVVAETHSR